jgi:hypothetical protein
MPRQITFDLKVSVQNDGSCVFYLIWDGGKRDLFASQLLPAKLRRDYDSWRRQYLRYYKLQPEQPVPRSGSFSVRPNGDTSSAVRNAEDALVTTFLDWLGAEDTRAIERQLQTALVEVAQSGDDDAPGTRGVNVFLACEDNFLQKLPWEVWGRNLIPRELPSNSIRVIRTARDDPQGLAGRQRQDVLKRPRILAILAKDKHLNMEGDWKILLDLRSVADVEKAKWLPNDPPHVITRKVFETIVDDRGWDILFFAGHSDDQANASGVFKLTPTVDLSINDIREHLETAQQQGLRLAIFNSCSGLAIAQSLVHLGVQAIAMREPVRSDAALAFLEQLCQRLREYADAQEAMSQACQVMRSAEKSKFPSAHFVPSFFSPPRVQPYRIKPYGWRQQVRKWLPTKQELLPIGAALLLGIVPGIQDALIEIRVAVQATYRDLTQQIPEMLPPVHLLALDQESLEEAGITNAERVPQAYLAQIINQLSDLKPRTLGIAYILSAVQERGTDELTTAMYSLHAQSETWFTMAVYEPEGLYVFNSSKDSNSPNILDISFQGDTDYRRWNVDLPDDADIESSRCPFNYLLSLTFIASKENSFLDIPESRKILLDQNRKRNSAANCERLIQDIEQRIPEDTQTRKFIRANRSLLGWRTIIDFSIPPEKAYTRTSTRNIDTLNLSEESISNQVFILGSGGYTDAEDNYYPPLALEYWWCLSPELTEGETNQDCDPRARYFSGAEAQAYMTSQLLTRQYITVIPNSLMILSAAFIGKGVSILLLRMHKEKRKRWFFLLLGGVGIYGLISLQIYISVSILIPYFFPIAVYVNYLIRNSRRVF